MKPSVLVTGRIPSAVIGRLEEKFQVDVYTGGFGAQYGGRISSIMDIQTRDGNNEMLYKLYTAVLYLL